MDRNSSLRRSEENLETHSIRRILCPLRMTSASSIICRPGVVKLAAREHLLGRVRRSGSTKAGRRRYLRQRAPG